MKTRLALVALIALVGFTWIAKFRLGLQSDGSYLVSSGQRIELLDRTLKLEGLRPKDLAISPDQSAIAFLTHAAVVVVGPTGDELARVRMSAGPLGIAWSPDGKQIYAANGSGKIASFVWSGTNLAKGPILAVEPAGIPGNPGTGGLAVGSDGTIYAALSIRNRVVALSPSGQILKTWNVEACPYHVCLSPDGRTLAVANRGGTIVAPNPLQGDPSTRGAFPGTGIAHADSAGTDVQIDPRTDAALVGTLSLIDIGGDRIRTVGVGRQPSGMSFSSDGRSLYVADADEDTLSIVDPAQGIELKRIPLAPKDDPTYGQIPTSVALSSDGRKIYVALGGANSVAVLDNGDSPKLDGYFPTAWYPIAIGTTKDRVIVGCAKGIGSRPSSKTTGFGVHDSVGACQFLTWDTIRDLKSLTRRVAANNSWTKIQGPRPNRPPVPVPERIGEPSVFTHVVYIIKENLTYDIAMGDFTPGNGDPSLCTFPENVTPNHHALARRFGLLDNFYISGTNSADGHQWVDSSIANDYTERNYGANERSYPFDGGDPLAFSPAGFLWTQAKAAGKSVRVFGEFVDSPSVIDTLTGKEPNWQRCWQDYKSGKGEVVIKAGTSQAALRDVLNPTYIGFPISVSDQWRTDVFLREFRTWEASGQMPNLTIMLLPADHTMGTSPGSPTPRASVADNDLALGRIVEALSHSKFWPQTAVFVAEDDSQNGADHVDGHRSISFCASAYGRPNVEIDSLYTHATIAATIERILGLPPMTRFDRTARPMFECFADTPNLTPYEAVPNRVPLDEVSPPVSKIGSLQTRQLAADCAKMDWSDPDVQNQDILNRAIWDREAPRSVAPAGYSLKYPNRK
jgi:DNA-binding beta-propeller fold protein YncE